MKKALLCLLVLGMYFGVCQAALDVGLEIQKNPNVAAAKQYFDAGNIRNCYEALELASSKDKTIPPSSFLISLFFLNGQKGPETRAWLERTVAQSPKYPGPYLILGNFSLQEQKFAGASLFFEKTISVAKASKNMDEARKNSFLQQAHQGLLLIAKNRQDWKLAHRNLTFLLSLKPKDENLIRQMAVVQFRLGERKEAYQRMKQTSGDKDAFIITMSRLYQEEGDMKNAEKWMRFALKENPQSEKVSFTAATWFFQSGQIEEAEKYLRKAKKQGLNSWEGELLEGMVFWYKKRYTDAIRILEKVIYRVPSHATANNVLALSLVEQKDTKKQERALQLAQLNARLYPNDTTIISTLGWVYYKLDKETEAKQALQRATSMGNVNAYTAYYLAHVMMKKEKLTEVQKLLRLALDTKGGFAFRTEAQKWLNRLSANPEKG